MANDKYLIAFEAVIFSISRLVFLYKVNSIKMVLVSSLQSYISRHKKCQLTGLIKQETWNWSETVICFKCWKGVTSL